jgi:EAL domain-containing protein (putative c-di-GMP-specific phosphodiesterase class I)
MSGPEARGGTAGVRLLSHRPSVLYKIEDRATEASEGDIADVGLRLTGPEWPRLLRQTLDSLTRTERACLYAIRLDDPNGLPLPADVLLARLRTDWFPEFLSSGRMVPSFQPIVDLASGDAWGREALMRGKMGTVEVRGAELVAAAEAHEALFSFDARARAAALETGLTAIPEGEVLSLNMDPRAVLDVQSSLRSTWPVIERLGTEPSRVCLEFINAEACADRELLAALVESHRERGALIALDNVKGGVDSLNAIDLLNPDVVKLDFSLIIGLADSPGRQRIAGAICSVARHRDCRVVATGVETVADYEAVRVLGADMGQGFYFGQPVERPLPIDPRLVQAAR